MRLHTVVALLACGVLASTASADVWTIGAPQDGGSWSQGFGFGTSGVEIDAVMIIAAPGTQLSLAGIDEFGDLGGSSEGWSMVANNSNVAIATGPATTGDLSAVFHFEGHFSTDAVQISIVTLRNGQVVENVFAEWSPGVLAGFWVILPGILTDEEIDGVLNSMMPLPAPLAMASLGLFGVLLGRKRLGRLVRA